MWLKPWKVPILQAPMAGVSTVELASQVTNCGALGSIAASTFNLPHKIPQLFQTLEQYKSQLKEAPGRGHPLPVNLNFFAHEICRAPTSTQSQNWFRLYKQVYGKSISREKISFRNGNVSFKEYESPSSPVLKELLQRWTECPELIPLIVSFHFGVPAESTVSKLHGLGISVFCCVTSVQEAEASLRAGVDGLSCQGIEAGGHRGTFLQQYDTHLSTRDLFNEVRKSFGAESMIVPAGGIMTAHAVQEYLSLGAFAVQMGTRFLACDGSLAKQYFRKLVKSDKTKLPDTTMTSLVSGKPARAVETPFIRMLQEFHSEKEDLPEYGYRYNAYKDFKKLPNENGLDVQFHLAGANYRELDELSVQEIVESVKH